MTTAHRAGTTSITTLVGIILTIGATHVAAPEWTRKVGLDVWNLPTLMAASQSSRTETSALQTKEEHLLREIEIADHLAIRLAEGSLSLAAATDEMEPLLQARPGFEISTQSHYHTTNLRHSTARYLISRIERGQVPSNGERSTVVARLEAEYAQLK